MNPFCDLGIGLSIIFGFILLGIVADLYYFHWKKRIIATHSNRTKHSLFDFSFFCFRRRNRRRPELGKLQGTLFTIVEETKEDLESNDGRLPRNGSRRSELTSLSSPPMKPPIDAVDIVRSSPPPTFKFMKDAEDKLLRKLVAQEAEMQRRFRNQGNNENSSLFGYKQNSQVIPITSSSSSSSPGLV